MTNQLVRITIRRKYSPHYSPFRRTYKLKKNGELSLCAINAIMKYFRFYDCGLSSDDLHPKTHLWVCCGGNGTTPTHEIKIQQVQFH